MTNLELFKAMGIDDVPTHLVDPVAGHSGSHHQHHPLHPTKTQKKHGRKSLVFFTLRLVLLFAVLTVLTLIALRSQKKVEAQWFNDLWRYRNSVSVSKTVANQTNVYIDIPSLVMTTAVGFTADCGDMRWTDQNGMLLSYVISSGCGGSSGDVHVLLPTFNIGTQTLYYYYGNPTASNGFNSADFSTACTNCTVGSVGSQEFTPGPLAYWGMDEGYGTSANDSTQQSNTGTLSGGSASSTTTKIDDASDFGQMPGDGRQVVRTSTGTLYASLNKAGSCEIWSSSNGSSWTQQDSANSPACTYEVSMAIDSSDNLHLIYNATSTIKYIKFLTGTNLFCTVGTCGFAAETIATAGGTSPQILFVVIDVDTSNIPHVAWTEDSSPDSTSRLKYSNRVGGSWKAAVTVASDAVNYYTFNDISLTIDNNSKPEISYTDLILSTALAKRGNANDAANFTESFDLDTTVSINGTSITVDSSGNTWVAYVDVTTNYITLREHLSASAWSSWETAINDSTYAGYDPQLAINGTDVYVFYQRAADTHIVYDKYTGSWLGETNLETGTTLQDTRVRWSKNNNASYTAYGIDYLFSDQTDVYWHNLVISSGSPPTWATEDQCMAGKCLLFTGANSSYVNVASSISGVKSVSFWVRPTSVTSISIMALNGTGGNASVKTDSSGNLSLGAGFTSPTCYLNGIAMSSCGATTLVANNWQHVVITTATAITASNVVLGQVTSAYLNGFMDEVKLYPNVKTAAQVMADYNSVKSHSGTAKGTATSFGDSNANGEFLSQGLVGYWKMDETAANGCPTAGDDSCDSSGNTKDGTWAGGATTTTAGKYASGVTFDGTGDYIDAGDIDL